MITGGSTTSECCCSAARNACDILLERLKPLREHMIQYGVEPTWEQLCKKSDGGGPGADGGEWPNYTPFVPQAIHVNLSASGMHEPKGRWVWLAAPILTVITTNVSSLMPSLRLTLQTNPLLLFQQR